MLRELGYRLGEVSMSWRSLGTPRGRRVSPCSPGIERVAAGAEASEYHRVVLLLGGSAGGERGLHRGAMDHDGPWWAMGQGLDKALVIEKQGGVIKAEQEI